MEIGLVRKIDIDNEMQQAYLDYAMSVIVARALPDARDGLKPVHRRILYAMHDMGLRPDSGYKKSARIVGEVLGKYHPHGDAAVYEAMARMAQEFSMRYTPVDGQGNFGSVDGDPPAAMRYTEARLAPMAGYMLADIQKNTVNFLENFDGTLQEPEVLPSALPNMLINGATGIAVGMATSIPPHNLREVVDALVHLLENWNKMDDIPVDDLMQFVLGPDFPTGGVILQDDGEDSLSSAYATGRGRVTVQARAMVEEMTRGRSRIIVTELPYMTNKAGLIERIANLVREEKIEGIADLRDESDRQGMRIVIELTKTGKPEKVLQDLYKSTPMRNTFSIIILALVEGEPRMLGLKQALRVYLEHRLEVVKRRSEYELERARHRAHILDGLRVALKNLDEVIALIRKAADAETAKKRLMRRYKLTEVQAQAILDMQLRRLAALERKKIEQEYKEALATIKYLEGLLRSPKKMRTVVADELLTVKETFGDVRRTQIVRVGAGETKVAVLSAQDFVEDKAGYILISKDGVLARTSEDKLPRMSGREAPVMLVRANTRDTLYLVAENGEAAALPVHLVPEGSSTAQGVDYWKVSPLTADDNLAAAFALPSRDDRKQGFYVLSVTRGGMVKRSAIGELPGPSAHTFTLMRVNAGDSLGWVMVTSGKEDVLLVTAAGMAIRFAQDQVRPMGLVAAGVAGIKLKKSDAVVGVMTMPARGHVLLLASDGSAKRVAVSQFPLQGRYGRGVIAGKLSTGVQLVGAAKGKATDKIILHLTNAAAKAIRFDGAPEMGRAARGRKVIAVKTGDWIESLVEVGKQLDLDVSVVQDGTEKRPQRTSTRATKKTTGGKSSPESEGKAKKTTRSTKESTKTTRATRGRPKKTAETGKTAPRSAGKAKSAKESTETTRAARGRPKKTAEAGKTAPRSAGKTKSAKESTKTTRATRGRPKKTAETGKAVPRATGKAKSAKGSTTATKAARGRPKKSAEAGKTAPRSAGKAKSVKESTKTTRAARGRPKKAAETGRGAHEPKGKTSTSKRAAKTSRPSKTTPKAGRATKSAAGKPGQSTTASRQKKPTASKSNQTSRKKK